MVMASRRRTCWWPVLLVALVLGGAPARTAASAPAPPGDDGIELIVFYGSGCPFCAKELDFLADLQDRQPLLEVSAYEVWNDAGNRELFFAVAAELGFEPQAVPTTVLGDLVWVGFDSGIGAQIESAVADLAAGRAPPPVERTTIDVPGFGAVDVGDRSLVVATALIGFVDGVNPCSLWVLTILLALVLHSGSRRRVLAVGAAFLAVTSALYGLYMFGAYTALDHANELGWVRVLVAAIAMTFGVLHLKEHLTHRGPSITIPDGKKPELYRRMRALAHPSRSLPAVLAGTTALAIGVSLVETPCTAGLPLLWTDLVAARDVPPAGVALLFALYLAVFLLDELIVFGGAVVTLRATKLQEHHGRALQLVSGALMVALAITMLVSPELLESLTGTLWLFALTGAGVALVLVGETAASRLRQGRPSTRAS